MLLFGAPAFLLGEGFWLDDLLKTPEGFAGRINSDMGLHFPKYRRNVGCLWTYFPKS
jgi:hypothetical protein